MANIEVDAQKIEEEEGKQDMNENEGSVFKAGRQSFIYLQRGFMNLPHDFFTNDDTAMK